MNLIPRKNSDDIFDDFLSFPPINTWLARDNASFMKTDIEDTEGKYVLHVDLPGYNKENIKVEMDKGYVTIKASFNDEKEDNSQKRNIIHKERYCGKCERTFYVGDDITEDDVNAVYTNGTLVITLPKVKVESTNAKKYISIK